MPRDTASLPAMVANLSMWSGTFSLQFSSFAALACYDIDLGRQVDMHEFTR